MSKPTCLYLHLPDAELAPDLLASTNTIWEYLPSLWRILLAGGTPGDTVPPLSGVPGLPTQTMQAPAQQAIERLAAFNTFLLGHPLLHRIPSLPVLLDSAHDFLSERLAAFAPQQREQVLVIGQIGANDWPADMPEYAQELDEMWQQIESMAQTRQYHTLDDVLDFAPSRHSFKQWRSWAHFFGLETLSDPYFAQLEYGGYWTHYHAAPAVKPYRKHQDARPDSNADAGKVSEGSWNFLKGAMRLVGLFPKASSYKGTGYLAETSAAYRDANEAGHPSAASLAEKQTADDATELEPSVEFKEWSYTGYHPNEVDGKFGLRRMTVSGDTFQLNEWVLPPEWDDIILPRTSTAWARRGSKWSLIALAAPCTVMLDACCDDVLSYDYARTTCIVKNDGLFGLFNSHDGRWIAPAEYEDITCWDDTGTSYWRVRRGQHWGMLDQSGEELQPCVFDSIEHDVRDDYSYKKLGWQVLRDGRAGWITSECEWEVSCQWDEVRPCLAPGLYEVSRAGRWGLLARGDPQWIPCDYLSVAPVAMAAHYGPVDTDKWGLLDDCIWPDRVDVPSYIAGSHPGRANVLVAVGTASGVGLVDQKNRPLVPCIYQSVTPAQSERFQDPRWLIVVAHDGRHGLWDMELAREILPCEAEWLGMVVSPHLARPMVWTVDQERHRLRHTDGSAAFDAEFRWIDGDYHEPFKREQDHFTRFATGQLTQLWDKGESVTAMLAGVNDEPDRLVLLLPGQAILSEHDSLTQAFMARGDRQAALRLANSYLSDRYQPKNMALARLWAGRACGYEPALVTWQAPVPEDEDKHRKQQNDLLEESARMFAGMLYQGAGGAQDLVLARHWAEVAANIDGHNTDAETIVVLAKILLDDSDNREDMARACALLEAIDAPSLCEGIACYYRAECLRAGDCVEQDWDLALELFVRADACGVYQAADDIANLLREMATALPMKTARLLMREADYYESKFQEATPGEAI
jgi:hypothetical protein